jgi:predicted  nucleic acid-binding Zn-ribbon protein
MKKVAVWTIAAAAGLLVAGLLFPKVGSHLSVAWHRIGAKFDKAVSPEWEIDRLKTELAKIEDDIKKSFGPVADQAVEVERLQKDIKDQRARLDEQKKAILTMKEDLEKGTRSIVYAGTEYSADTIRTKLSHDFETYKVGEKGLQTKEEQLKLKQTALEAARQRLDEMKSTKQQLEVEVARLETELQTVRMEQAKADTKASFDDTRLGQTKEDVQHLADRIASMREELKLQAQYQGPKDVDVTQKVKSKDVVKDVDDYFGNKADKVVEQK